MDTLVKPIVKLQRFRTVIQCPGCVQLFYVDDECAAHLLKNCLQFRSNDDHESRRNVTAWIVDYFKTLNYGEQNPPDSVKINSWLNDNRISITMKASLRVNIPDLSSSICCPVCHKFSLTAEACLEHLFTQCLYVENKDASLVRNWLCDYFSTKTEKKLNILKYVLSNYSASRILCKYCKTEAPDQESLMKHFPCPQRRFGNPNELMCEVCNFSVPDLPKLMVHMISKHYRCHACGIWPKNGKIDFIALKHHLKCCDPRGPTVFRCPLCFMDVPVEAEHDLSSHIANCKKVRAESEFDNRSLYGKCDILNCTDQILLCDVDAHMRKHLKKGDLPSSRQKRSRLSLDDLNNLVMHSFKDRRSSVCICNGNLR